MKRRRPSPSPEEVEEEQEEEEEARRTGRVPSLVSRLRGLEHTASYARLGMREGQTTIVVPSVANDPGPYPLLGDGHMHDPLTGDVVDEAEANRMPGHGGFVADLQRRLDLLDQDPDVQFAHLLEGCSHNRSPTAFIDVERMRLDTERAAALTAKGIEARQKAATAGPGKKTEVLQAARALLNAAVLERDQATTDVATPIVEAFRVLQLERFASVVPLPATEGSKVLTLGTGYLFPYYWRYQYRLAAHLLTLAPSTLPTVANWPALMQEMRGVYAYDRDVIFPRGWAEARAGRGPALAQTIIPAVAALEAMDAATMPADTREEAIITFVRYLMMRDLELRPFGPLLPAPAPAAPAAPAPAVPDSDWLPRAAGDIPFLRHNRYLSGWLSDTLVRAMQHMRQVLPWACAARNAPAPVGTDTTVAGDDLADKFKELFDVLPEEADAANAVHHRVAEKLASGVGTHLVHVMPKPNDPRRGNVALASPSEPVLLSTLDEFYRAFATSLIANEPTIAWAMPPRNLDADELVLKNAYTIAAYEPIQAGAFTSLGLPVNLFTAPVDGVLRSTWFTSMVATGGGVFSHRPPPTPLNHDMAKCATLLPTLSHYEWACDVLDGILSPVLVAAARRLFTIDYVTATATTTTTAAAAAAAATERLAPNLGKERGGEEAEAAPFALYLPTVLPRMPTSAIERDVYRGFGAGSTVDARRIDPPGQELPADRQTGDLLKIIAYASQPLLGSADARIFKTVVTRDGTGAITTFIDDTNKAAHNVFARFQRREWAGLFRRPNMTIATTEAATAGSLTSNYDVSAPFLGRQVVPALMGEFGRRWRDELRAAVFDPGLGASTAVRAPVEIRPRPVSRAAERTRARRRELDDLIEAFQQLVSTADARSAPANEQAVGNLVKPLLARVSTMLKKAFDDTASSASSAGGGGGDLTMAATAAAVQPSPLFLAFMQSGKSLTRYLAAGTTSSLFARMQRLEPLDPLDVANVGRLAERRARYAFWLNNTVGERDAVDRGMPWPKLFLFLDYVRWVFSDAGTWDARVDHMERLVNELERQWEVLAQAELLDRSVARLAQDLYVPTVAEQMHPTITGRFYLTPKFHAVTQDALGEVRKRVDPTLTLEYLTSPLAGQGRVRYAFAKFAAATDQYWEQDGPTGYMREKQFGAVTRKYQDAFNELRAVLEDEARLGMGPWRAMPFFGSGAAAIASQPALFTII